ncbi:hypothetical protein E4U55_007270 [Claviceps digitariae]|nr:hypothetical protein E4U55_007270 [Claviceps digitariae]
MTIPNNLNPSHLKKLTTVTTPLLRPCHLPCLSNALLTSPDLAFPSPLLRQPAMSSPIFWSAPVKYCRWAARERPAIFWSLVIGAIGPIALPIVPPIRRYFGDIDPAPVPVTYPVPNGPRKQLSGYDD